MTDFHPLFASVDSAPVAVDASGNVTLRIYVDRSSVEVFAQNGLRTITDQVFPERVLTAGRQSGGALRRRGNGPAEVADCHAA